MKKVFIFICFFIGLFNILIVCNQPIISKSDSTLANLIKMENVEKQIERKFLRIEIGYLDMLKNTTIDFSIWNDSILLKKYWYKKNIKGQFTKEVILKDFEVINILSEYVFFFFVEKNKYIILNPREPGEKMSGEKIIFDITVYRKGYNPIKKKIIVEPDFMYSEEFMDFLELLDSF